MLRIVSLLILGVALAGCSAPNKKLVQIQQDKEQLLVAIRDQRDKNRQLQGQVASLETRLDQAEKELARAGSGTRISSRPANPMPPARSEPLPWRSPAEKSKQDGGASGAGNSKMGGQAPRKASGALEAGALEALAARDSRIHYDRRSGQAQLDAPLTFDEKTGNLTAESKRQLDQVSKLLRSDEARNLQISISTPGGRERAQAVADYLDRHGIPAERLSVAPSSSITPASIAPASAQRNAGSEVRITLSESQQPLRR